MVDGTTATLIVGAGAILVGLVQAAIYNSQRRIQDLANKQALFERRMKAYLDIKCFAEHYVEREGVVGSSQQRTAYDEALTHAPFIFSRRARKGIASVERRLNEHAAEMPPREYDFYGGMMKSTDTEPVAELTKLKLSLKALPSEVEADLRLTS